MLRAVPVLLSLALGAACSNGNEGSGGGGGSAGGTGSTTTQTPTAERITAIAWRATNEGGASQGDAGSEAQMLYLGLANYSLACPSSIGSDCLNEGEWWATIGIPPSLQTPGSYAIDAAGLVTDSAESGSGADDCCFCGGGALSHGTLEIVSIDSAKVVVRLSGQISPYRVDGDYSADICP